MRHFQCKYSNTLSDGSILRRADSTPSPPPANWAKPPHGRENELFGRDNYARTHLGRSSPGARFAEASAASLLEITARNCRLAAEARAARTDPGRGTPDSPDAGECDRRLADP